MQSPTVVAEFARQVSALGWVGDLWVGGSLAAGDHRPGVSDLDLVAVVDGPLDASRVARLTVLHRAADRGFAAGAALGCVWVEQARLADAQVRHPTWTHGALVRRRLSGIARAELVAFGHAVLGRGPGALLAPMTPDDVRRAAREEVTGYWAWAARRPWLWLAPGLADLGLTAMARARHTVRTGELLTKTRAIEQVAGPARLVGELRARRRGEAGRSPRLATGWLAWRDARRTVAAIRREPTREDRG